MSCFAPTPLTCRRSRWPLDGSSSRKFPTSWRPWTRKRGVVGYGFGTGWANMISTIILSKTGVKLGLVGGAKLPDPERLLEGSGKVHRYVKFAEASAVSKPGVKSLLASNVAAWRKKRQKS